jgi:Uma2 family endonuclease
MALSQITWLDVQELPDDGHRHGEMLHAPVGVEFPSTGEGVQPDIVVIAAARRGIIDDDWIRGAPDIVVEILSPGTQRRDRGVKLKLYGSQGVGEYWIVDPGAGAVEAWRFESGARCERFTDRLPVQLAGKQLGEIDLAEVFQEV